jgi:hypothetical protein
MRGASRCSADGWLGLRGGGADFGVDGCDDVGRESAFGGVSADDIFVRRNVDAVDLVGCDEGVDPLDLRTDSFDNRARFLRDGGELVGGELAGAGKVALDEELGHCGSPLGGIDAGPVGTRYSGETGATRLIEVRVYGNGEEV